MGHLRALRTRVLYIHTVIHEYIFVYIAGAVRDVRGEGGTVPQNDEGSPAVGRHPRVAGAFLFFYFCCLLGRLEGVRGLLRELCTDKDNQYIYEYIYTSYW